jgi:hypothetical protein
MKGIENWFLTGDTNDPDSIDTVVHPSAGVVLDVIGMPHSTCIIADEKRLFCIDFGAFITRDAHS